MLTVLATVLRIAIIAVVVTIVVAVDGALPPRRALLLPCSTPGVACKRVVLHVCCPVEAIVAVVHIPRELEDSGGAVQAVYETRPTRGGLPKGVALTPTRHAAPLLTAVHVIIVVVIIVVIAHNAARVGKAERGGEAGAVAANVVLIFVILTRRRWWASC